MNRVRWYVLIGCLFISCVAWAQDGFVLKDSSGKELRLSELRGKWVVVNFWAPWCPPCLEEIPDLIEAYEARGARDLMVIGVAIDYEDRKEVLRLVESMLVPYPIVLGEKAVKAQFGTIKGLPMSLIYDPEGKLTQRHMGRISRSQLAKLTGGQ